MYQDKTLTCKDCGQEFTFSANEQEFYASKGFENEPGRCPSCRSARKQQRGGFGGGARRERQMYPATCSECGTETTVPFQPTGDRPIYCRDCFQSKRG
jgi:CxxC-x17-CxxC domain-containing protein